MFPADLDEGVLFCHELLFIVMFRPVAFYPMVYCFREDVLYTLIQIGRFVTGSIVSMFYFVLSIFVIYFAVLSFAVLFIAVLFFEKVS